MAKAGRTLDRVVKYADMFSAIGAEARLRIMQLLLSAHPEGLVVGEDPKLDAQRFRRTEKGICLITQAMIDRLA